MRIINTLADIALLEQYKILSPSYLQLVKDQFREIYDYNQDGETEAEFTLEHCGPIFVLEQGDNVHDLSILGLHSQQGGLLATEPESVALLQLLEGEVWKVLVVYNDSYLPIFFLEVGKFGNDVDNFLANRLE